MSQIKVTVTQEDIDNGVMGMADSCAIAQAIMREFTTTKVRVQPLTTVINGVYYKTSTRAKRFIERFDKVEVVKPSVFIFKTKIA